MTAEVDIVNLALSYVGADRITSLTQANSDSAALANNVFAGMRDSLLRAHTWNFATKRIKLAQSATTPTFGFDYQYPIPSDFLRVVSVHDNDAGVGNLPYKIENDATDTNVIRTDATNVWLRYIARITDPTQWDTTFRETLALKLAALFAVPLAQSNSLADRMENKYMAMLRSARAVDGQEDYPEKFPDGSWAESRVGDSWWPE